MRGRSVVRQTHFLAHVAHGFLRILACLVTAIGDDRAHQRRVVEVFLRALAHRLLLFQDAVDDWLLAFDAANAG